MGSTPPHPTCHIGSELDARRLQAVLELEGALAGIGHQIADQQRIRRRLVLVGLENVEGLVLQLGDIDVLQRVVGLGLDLHPARRAVNADATVLGKHYGVSIGIVGDDSHNWDIQVSIRDGIAAEAFGISFTESVTFTNAPTITNTMGQQAYYTTSVGGERVPVFL